MPNYVAIEICDNKLLVACAKSGAGRFQIHQLFDMDTSEETTDEAVGSALKLFLGEKGVARSELIGVVGRQESEIREVTVPPAPDNELPDLVRFQARNVFASLNDNWLLDYVPFEQEEGQERRVLAAAIAPQVCQRFEDIASAAGLKLKRIVFRPFALTHLFEQQLSGGNGKLLVVPNGNRFDLTVTQLDSLVATRTFRSPADQDSEATAAQITGEIRRTIASTRKSLAATPMDHVIVGVNKKHWGVVESELNSQLDLPVTFNDPIRCLPGGSLTVPKVPDNSERFAAVLGSLVRECSNKKQVVDFLNPRRPEIQKRDFRRVLIPAVAAALIFLLAAAFGWYRLNSQSNEIAEKQEKLAELKKRNEGDGLRPGVDMIIGEVNELDRWQARKVNWLDELAWISEKMLTPDDVVISKFRGIENREGFKIELSSRMTKARSQETGWKELFSERYEGPSFGQTTEDPSYKDHPVQRPFTLVRKADIDATVEAVSKVAFKNRDKELGLEDSEATGSPAEPAENDPQESTDQ